MIDSIVRLIVRRQQQAAREIWTLAAIEFALFGVGEVLRQATSLCSSILGDDFIIHLNLRLIEHANRLSLASLEDPVLQDKMDRARRQSSGRLTLFTALLNMCQEALNLALLLGGLLTVSPWAPVCIGLGAIPVFLGETQLTKLAYSVFYRRTPQRRLLDYLRYLSASGYTAKEVRVFGLGVHLLQRYRDNARAIEDENRALSIKKAIVSCAFHLCSTIGYCGAYVIVLVRAVAQTITVGTFTFLTAAVARSRSAIERILGNFGDVADETMALKDLFEFLETESPSQPIRGTLPAPRPLRNGFDFRNVSFAYRSGGRLALTNINARFEPGEKIALIGENGAGKTSLVKLMTRLYDPTEGRIFLDGTDLREYDIDDLRREVGVMFQDFVRYDLAVRDNIGFGNIEHLGDDGRLRSAAGKSLADHVIARLPGGYEQVVGKRFEGGIGLSGGEWQKLALARAYMRDAQILILDEPTAALDATAEYQLFQRFAQLTQGRLTLLISHRFSTVRMADRIIVLAGGTIHEEGTHNSLLSAGGRYAEFFKLQAVQYG